ncbi:MAG: ParB N-terminal domain-containing protein [Deltaproteobacteria bacterium]|nr:ParB N-terminal domain-containing protein [Deltaproteobacteria bacterium]
MLLPAEPVSSLSDEVVATASSAEEIAQAFDPDLVEDEPQGGAEPEVAADAEEPAEPEGGADPDSQDSDPDREAQPEGEVGEAEDPPRESKPGALALLKLEKVDEDTSCQIRPVGEVDSLATSMARLGQLFPVDLWLRPPDRFQIICGFRRIAALRLLKRERVLARVHTDISDEDALRIALADALEHQGASREELEALRARLEAEHRLVPAVKEALDRVLSPVEESLGPEMVENAEEEVDLDELSQDITKRLATINQDLALVAELWSAMEPGLRRALLEQLAYPEQLSAYLRSL